MADILIIAPHPDDEVLGCGGTILKHVAKGDTVHWCIASVMSKKLGFTKEQIKKRDEEIEAVEAALGFTSVTQLDFPATQLDQISKSDFVSAMKDVFETIQPQTVYLPHPADIHSDHAATFDAAIACTKWFRNETIERILCYETLSETDFQINPALKPFAPNVYVDISNYLDQKLDAIEIYESEVADFPFPRSHEALTALAKLRGAASGTHAAEAFQLLKEIL